MIGLLTAESAETQDRTGDTAIFSRVLYQLSYLGLTERGDFTRTAKDCQENFSQFFA